MHRTKLVCSYVSILEFVESFFCKSNRKCMHRALFYFRQKTDHRAAVGSSAQEAAQFRQRYIIGVLKDRLLHPFKKFTGEGLFRGIAIFGVFHVPVLGDSGGSLVPGQKRTGRKLLDSFVGGKWRRNGRVIQISNDR